jgi:hypothetical protein
MAPSYTASNSQEKSSGREDYLDERYIQPVPMTEVSPNIYNEDHSPTRNLAEAL